VSSEGLYICITSPSQDYNIIRNNYPWLAQTSNTPLLLHQASQQISLQACEMLIPRRCFINCSSLSSRQLITTPGLRCSRRPAPNRNTRPFSSGSSVQPVSDVLESPPSIPFEDEEAVEPVSAYRKGGYHPTHIGDFHQQGRYEIVHKLGHGSYSTVWLARDHQTSKHVALKILIAEVSRTNKERDILRALSTSQTNHHGRPIVRSLLMDLVISGTNGTHQCLVTPICGSNLALSKEECTDNTWRFPVNAARAIAAQALLFGVHAFQCSGTPR